MFLVLHIFISYAAPSPCQLVFVLHFIASIISLIKNLCIKRLGYFKETGWNYLEILLIFIDTFIIILFALRQITANETMKQFHEDEGRRFVNFALNALIADNLLIAMSLAMFFGIIKSLKMMRFNEKVGLLSLVLKTAYQDMYGMIISFIICI